MAAKLEPGLQAHSIGKPVRNLAVVFGAPSLVLEEQAVRFGAHPQMQAWARAHPRMQIVARMSLQFWKSLPISRSMSTNDPGASRNTVPAQAELPLSKAWGGRRKGAGRPPRPQWARTVAHLARPEHKAAHPVHVTLRVRRALGASLRAEGVFHRLRNAIRATNHVDKGAFRIVHFSVQTNHMHLIVEASGKSALRRGAAGLSIRLARSINRCFGRRGRVWAERYHSLAMTTPRQVRNAIVYVLFNVKKHHRGTQGTDPCSSAMWFDGFLGTPARDHPAAHPSTHDPPVATPRTWLLSVGWRRHGLLSHDEAPAH